MSPDGHAGPVGRRRIAAAVAFSRPDVGPLGWGWLLLVLFLLFYPFTVSGATSVWKDILPYAIHVGMWAGLVWSLWPLARGSRSGQWLLLALLVLAGGVSEVIQGMVGRSPEWLDLGMDALGAFMAFLCGRGHWKTGLGLAGVFCAVLMGCVGARAMEEIRAYPVLMDGGSRWGRYRWERNGVKMRPRKKHLGVILDRNAPTEYPGLFRSPLCRDWSGSKGMEVLVYWPQRNGGDGILGFRIDDRPGNPPYADRWQTEVAVTSGWNTVVLTGEWLQTPGGRRMDASRIRDWGVFVISSPKTNYFGLGTTRLLFDSP